jgi:hypothetical protein
MDKFLIPGVAFAPNCTSHSKGSPFVREGPRTHSLLVEFHNVVDKKKVSPEVIGE